MKNKKHLIITLFATMLAGTFHANGQTTGWGTGASVNPLSFDSAGNVETTMNWTIGYFTDGFIPTQTNFMDWAANWTQVDKTEHHIDYDGIWSVSSVSNAPPEAVGKEEWIFAYNDFSLIGTDQGQVLLYDPGDYWFQDIGFAETHSIPEVLGSTADDNFNLVWGRVDRLPFNAGGIMTGGGVFQSLVPDSNIPPEGNLNSTFNAQFASWPSVPEPSTALLGGLGVLFLLRRKRQA